ncbi:MAG: SIS domain-containing protein [bacterium]
MPGDIFVGISTSGNSTNIIKAIEVCKEKHITTIALLGK